MLRRFLLGLIFVGSFAFVGVGIPEQADAWRRWRRPYVSYYSAPPRAYYYNSYRPYRAYYGPRTYYRSYARPYYGGYYGPSYYGYGPGVSVSFGF